MQFMVEELPSGDVVSVVEAPSCPREGDTIRFEEDTVNRNDHVMTGRVHSVRWDVRDRGPKDLPFGSPTVVVTWEP